MMTERRYEQIKELGRQAGRAGTKPERNPYKGASLWNESAAWEAGRIEGEAQRKARVGR